MARVKCFPKRAQRKIPVPRWPVAAAETGMRPKTLELGIHYMKASHQPGTSSKIHSTIRRKASADLRWALIRHSWVVSTNVRMYPQFPCHQNTMALRTVDPEAEGLALSGVERTLTTTTNGDGCPAANSV